VSECVDIGTFECRRGDAYQLPITDVQADGVSPTNLTAYGSAWTAKLRTSFDATTAIDFTVDASNAATGHLVLSLTGAVTGAMLAKDYVFDVQVTGGTQSPLTLYAGVLSIVKDVTHA
jgi:hypothetical protein